MTVHFGSKDRPLSSWTVHFGSNDRPVWLKTVHFHPFGPSTLDQTQKYPQTSLKLVTKSFISLKNHSDHFPLRSGLRHPIFRWGPAPLNFRILNFYYHFFYHSYPWKLLMCEYERIRREKIPTSNHSFINCNL